MVSLPSLTFLNTTFFGQKLCVTASLSLMKLYESVGCLGWMTNMIKNVLDQIQQEWTFLEIVTVLFETLDEISNFCNYKRKEKWG